MIDQETIYKLLYEQQWTALLDVLHRYRDAITTDPLLAHAASVFVGTFFDHLTASNPEDHADTLEKLFLLHTGGFYTLPPTRFEHVVEALVILHADRPEAAQGYARFCPENACCAALLAPPSAPPPPSVLHAQAATLDLAVSPPLTDTDATISLFKSQQEADFFLAVREVYATYLVYPNVALSCLVAYASIKAHLTAEERQYFFRGIVDCVVFDQHNGYRPLHFFELDSALHDTEAQRTRDRYKERILALAGRPLYRIRKRDAETGRSAFVALLKELAEKKDFYRS